MVKFNIPPYKKMENQQIYNYIIIILSLFFLIFGLVNNMELTIIFAIVNILIHAVSLKLVDFKIRIRDKIKKTYEIEKNIKLTRKEFDKGLISGSND